MVKLTMELPVTAPLAAEFNALTATLYAPAVVGLPDISPVTVFNDNPGGSGPLLASSA